MRVFFSGSGKDINMHLMGISVKEAMELNKIYKDDFKGHLEKYNKCENVEFKLNTEESQSTEETVVGKEHNLDEYLAWRGNTLNNLGRIKNR